MLSSLMTGSETLPSIIDSLNPILKGIGSLRNDKTIVNKDGEVVGTIDTGIPGFTPHIQETPFFAFYMSMTEAVHYYPTVPQIYSQKREIDYPRGNVLGESPPPTLAPFP